MSNGMPKMCVAEARENWERSKAEASDRLIEWREMLNRQFFGDPYSTKPMWKPLWAGDPAKCPHELRIRTAYEIRNGIE